MTSRLREAAGYWITHGRAIGRLDQTRGLVETFTRSAAAAREQGNAELADKLEGFAHHFAEQLGVLENLAAGAKKHAEELMTELEHPGAKLARRLVSTFHSARAAWRGSR